MASITDKPIAKLEQDSLNIQKYANSLSKFIRNSDTPITIGLQGEWGTGKTSLMSLLLENFNKDGEKREIATSWVNTWEYSLFKGASETTPAVLSGMLEKLRDENKDIWTIKDVATDKVKKATKFFKKIWGGEVGGDAEFQPLLNTYMPMDAKALLDAHALILKRSVAISMTDRSLPIRVAASLKQTSQNGGLMLIFDHNFGGGANAYSKQILEAHLKGGNEVLRVWYEPNKLTFGATYYTPGENIDIKIKNLNQVFEICTTFKPQATLVNSLWTYINLPLVLDNLIRLKLYGYTQRLEVFAHDHMGICPSLFLLDENFKYCGVPEDIKKCKSCLKKNIQEFDVFFSNIDILEWRKNWESFFRNCDTIRFFSQSTKSHYLRAYPWLDKTNAAIVEGHVVEDFFEQQVDLKVLESDDFRIGIFGFIGAHKGSGVVKAIAARINELEDKASVYVFGSLDGISKGSTDSLKIMGSYDRSDLVALCEDNKIDMAFVPSICPETYSFITKELMLIGMPVATFDLGGQKELVSSYDKGHILELAGKSPVYDRLKRIFNATYKK